MNVLVNYHSCLLLNCVGLLAPWPFSPSSRISQPTYLAEVFITRRRIEFGRGDAFPVLEIPGWSSEAGRNSLVCECSQFWNELPNRIRYMPSLRKLKTALYKHLFEIDS